jgi:hypothetical protein
VELSRSDHLVHQHARATWGSAPKRVVLSQGRSDSRMDLLHRHLVPFLFQRKGLDH